MVKKGRHGRGRKKNFDDKGVPKDDFYWKQHPRAFRKKMMKFRRGEMQ